MKIKSLYSFQFSIFCIISSTPTFPLEHWVDAGLCSGTRRGYVVMGGTDPLMPPALTKLLLPWKPLMAHSHVGGQFAGEIQQMKKWGVRESQSVAPVECASWFLGRGGPTSWVIPQTAKGGRGRRGRGEHGLPIPAGL